jgi:mannose-6-phosphate isomerase-like protein (cupin superfamily)
MAENSAFVVNPGEARGQSGSQAPLNIFGDLIWIKLASADTAGAVTILETVSPPQVGPPLHRHGREDEWFYVVEGEYLIEVEGTQTVVGPGGSAFAPRGTVHTFQNISSGNGRLVVVAQPGGIDLFFTELAQAIKDMPVPDIPAVIPIFARHGLEFLGPPIAARGQSAAAS